MILTVLKKIGKMALAFLIFIAISVVSVLIASVIFDLKAELPEMINSTMNSSRGNALQAAISIVLTVGILVFAVKKGITTPKALGLDEAPKKAAAKLALGFLAGAVLVIAEVGLLCVIGKTRATVFLHGLRAIEAVLCGLIIYASVGLTEEALFRGYYQGLFEKHKGRGIVITALLFAMIHLVNSAYSPASLIYLVAGGFFFSLLREVTESLWLPIGLHIAWDWTEISIFGVNEESEKHWLSVKINEVTGSIVCAVMMLVLSVILLIVYRKRSMKNA